jgi:hypothetical protein
VHARAAEAVEQQQQQQQQRQQNSGSTHPQFVPLDAVTSLPYPMEVSSLLEVPQHAR